jgi:hypothetical protein
MKFQKIRQYLSAPRINRYLVASGNNIPKANKLYKANIKVVQAFHPLISLLEVILRNRINDILVAYFTDPDWIQNQKTGFMNHPSLRYRNKHTGNITVNDFLKKEVDRVEKRIRASGKTITSAKIIAEQNFSFWTNMFEVCHFKILHGQPIKIFKTIPKGYGRKDFCYELNKIRSFRNRINHNEPVCFDSHTVSFTYAREVYAAIINIFHSIDPDIIAYIQDIDKVKKTIDAAEKII